MAFSFNPTQTAQAGTSFSANVPQGTVQAPGGPVKDAPASIPDSPFLFLRNRDQDMTINAYLQLLLLLGAALSVLFSIVLFTYGQYLSMSIDQKKAELASKEGTFKAYPFDDMLALSNRIAALEKNLKSYVSSRSPLKYLESVVENQVVFDNFSFNNDKKSTRMDFTIVTNNQRALIQQLAALDLTQYSKRVPSPKADKITDAGTVFKAQISAPVYVQGVLSEEILFITPATTTTP